MLRSLHRWLGLGLSAYLLLACLTGTLLLWSDEYVAWSYPDVAGQAIPAWPPAQALEALQIRHGDSVTSIGLPREGRPVFHLYLDDSPELLAHPVTLETIAIWSWSDSLPAFLFDLHAHLLAGDVGHTVVGVLGLGIMISLGSGLWLWWQRRHTLRLRNVLPHGFTATQLVRGHAAQGAALGALFILLTGSGVAMVFPQPVTMTLNGLLGAEALLRPSARLQNPHLQQPDWQAVLTGARAALPHAQPRFIIPPRRPDDPVIVRLKNPDELHPNGRSYVAVDPRDGTVLEVIDATTRGLGPAVFDALYPLHAGKTGWFGHRPLLSMASLSLLFILGSGTWLWMDRRRRQASSANLRCQRSSARQVREAVAVRDRTDRR